jgi:uncharacterized integral membrane protein
VLRTLYWIVTPPLTVVFLLFVLSNRESVTLGLWPLGMTITAPLYLFFLGTVIISFFAGSSAMWLMQHKYRRDARRYRYEAAKLRETIGAPASSPGSTLPRIGA